MKNLIRAGIFLFALVLLGVSSCKEDSVIPPDLQYRHYFPATVGSYIIYDCDSVVVNDFTGETDTFRFKIKEYFESAFSDNAGRPSIRLERWKLPADSTQWFLTDVWYLTKTDLEVEKIEEDVRYIKLMFPVKESREWNINALNSLGQRIVIAEKVHQPFSTGAMQFDSTVTVVNTDPSNLVYEFRDTEVFAANVGLIYKKLVNVSFVVPTPEIKSGSIFTMQAVETGTE